MINNLGATALIGWALYALVTDDRALSVACFGWACALVNRAELQEFKKEIAAARGER